MNNSGAFEELVSRFSMSRSKQHMRLPRSLRSLAMTVQGVGEALAASRTGARKGRPYARPELINVVIARSVATRQSRRSCAGGFETRFETCLHD